MEHYRALSPYLKERFGCKVYKLSLSSGCTCPNRDGTLGTQGCSFCSGADEFTASSGICMQEQLAQARLILGKKAQGAKFIAYFQSFTNTYGAPSRLEPLFMQAIAPQDVVALSVATRPDCLPPEIMQMLARLREKKPLWVELGLQTMHGKTAREIGRGYDLPVFEKAVRELHAIGAEVIAHMILGLPGETPEMMEETARYLGACGVDGVKLHLLHVLCGTGLAAAYEAGAFQTLALAEYITILERCLAALPPKIVIHRLTGDGAKRDLIAPMWSADKRRVLNEISRRFALDHVTQGSAL